MSAFGGLSDGRPSPSLRTLSPDNDPFNLTPTSSGGGRHRYSSFDTSLFGSYNQVSPTQAKRALEAHLVDTERRIRDASTLGTTLLDQRSELEARLRDVESRQSGNAMGSELTQKLMQLEREYNEVGKETARQFIPKKKQRNGNGFSDGMSDDGVLSSNGQMSPSKPSIGSPVMSRNGTSNNVHDIEFATEISTSLLSQVRALQGTLVEKEEALRRAYAEKANMQQEADIFALKLRSLEDNEQRAKDESWQLEIQNQRLMSEIKESAAREQRLTHSVNSARSHQSTAEQEYDDLRMTHNKLNDDHQALRRQHDAEVLNIQRSLANRDSEVETLQRRLDELSAKNEELVDAAAYRHRMDQENADAAAGQGDTEMFEPNTPDPSPPASPVKATPRHGALESETLKSSLQHAHKMIQNLKNNIHREKTEKIELRRMLQDARDELEARRGEGGAAAGGAKKRAQANQGAFKKPARPDMLGGSKNAMDEIINDPSWEEFDDSPTKRRAGGQRDLYDLTTDADDAFETANERDSMMTETEGFQTGLETLPGDSEEELTETEESQTTRARTTTMARLTGANRARSFQSTASDDTYSFNLNTPLPDAQRRFRLTSNPGLRSVADERGSARDSPASFTSDARRTKPGHNLASELEDFEGDDSSIAASTPGRNFESENSTPATRLREGTPAAYYAATKPEMVDAGTMTEEWEPQAQAATASGADLGPTTTIPGGFPGSPAPINQSAYEGFSLPPDVSNSGNAENSSTRLKTSRNSSPVQPKDQLRAPQEGPLEISAIASQAIKPVQPAEPAVVGASYTDHGVQPTPPRPAAAKSYVDHGEQPTPSRAPTDSMAMAGSPTTLHTPLRQNQNAYASPAAAGQQQNTPQIDLSSRGAPFGSPNGQNNNSPAFSNPIQPWMRDRAVTRTPQDISATPTQSAAPSMSFVDNLIKHPPPSPHTEPNVAQMSLLPTVSDGLHDATAVRFSSPGDQAPQPPTAVSRLNSVNTQATNFVPNRQVAPGIAQVDPKPMTPDRSNGARSVGPMTDGGRLPVQTFNPSGPDGQMGQSAGPVTLSQSFESDNTRPPFRPVSGNAPTVNLNLSGQSNSSEMDQLIEKREGKRRAVSESENENATQDAARPEVRDTPRRELTPILSTGSASPRNARSGSLNARFSTEPATYIEPEEFGPPGDPSQRSSALPAGYGPPPLPSGHREAIAAASSRTSTPATVGGPQMPPSSWRGSSQGRPRTPNGGSQAVNFVDTNMPQSRTASFARTDATQRTSMSSMTSEMEGRYRSSTPGRRSIHGPEDMALQNADPRMIQAITQTMIGEFLFKYTRKTGRDEHSAKRHRRFFWIHPYTRTLYWSNQDPSHAGKTELKAKSVAIEAVRVVSDDSQQPPGLHSKSIIVVTPGRSIKFTAPTAQRHETWFNALSYLLLRTPATDPGNAGATLDGQQRSASGTMTSSTPSRPVHQRSDTQSSINSDDVSEFNPGGQSRSTNASNRSQSATGRGRGRPSGSEPSTTASRSTRSGAGAPPSETHPAMRSGERADEGSAPAPNIPTINSKEMGGHERAPSTGPDGFKKPQVPPPRAPSANSSKRGRLNSFTDRLSFFGRGRSKSRGRESEVGNTGDVPAVPQEPVPVSTLTTTNVEDGHVHVHSEGPGLENVRACCDGEFIHTSARTKMVVG